MYAVLTYEEDHKSSYYAGAVAGSFLLSYWCCCCLFDPCYSLFGIGRGTISERDTLNNRINYNSTNSLLSVHYGNSIPNGRDSSRGE